MGPVELGIIALLVVLLSGGALLPGLGRRVGATVESIRTVDDEIERGDTRHGD